MKIHSLFLPIVLIICYSGVAQNADQWLRENIGEKELLRTSIGIQVMDVRTKQSVFSYQPEKLLIPASTHKLLTTSAAIDLLGKDYCFKTSLVYTGRIEKGILKGDMVIVGGGDPTLGSSQIKYKESGFLDNCMEAVRELGVTRIEGNLILDIGLYADTRLPDTWIWEDIGNYYGVAASPLTYKDNSIKIEFQSPKRPGKSCRIRSLSPKLPRLEIDNRVEAAASNRDNAYVYGSPLHKSRIIRGSIPAGRKSFVIKAANHFPEETLAADFLDELKKEGITLSGEIIKVQGVKKTVQPVYTHLSASLMEIIKLVHHESNNLFAEHLFLQLSAGAESKAGTERSTDILCDVLDKFGLEKGTYFIEDGCGLSHFNAISPQTMCELLIKKHDDPFFTGSLPAAGEGTLSGFPVSAFPGNTLRAKSGSQTRVRSYAGYLKTDSGNELVFTIIFNHFLSSHSSIKKESIDLLRWLKSEF